MKNNLIHCKNIMEARNQISNFENIVVICTLNFVEEVEEFFHAEDAVKFIVCFQVLQGDFDENFGGVQDLGYKFVKFTNK